jgi:hypothetical protein
LTQLDAKYEKDGFEVIAVNDWDEPKEDVAKFAAEQKLTHTILLMGGKMSPELYGVTSSPTSFWIDHRGIVVRRERGFDPSEVSAMEKRIQKLLAQRNGKPSAAQPAPPPATTPGGGS